MKHRCFVPSAVILLHAAAFGQVVPSSPAPARPSATAAVPAVVRIRADTIVEFQLDQAISSADVKVGDRIRFTLVNDLAAAGRVAAPAGTFCYATITKAHPKDGKHDGYLAFSDPRLDLGHGQTVRFTTEDSRERRQARVLYVVGPAFGMPLLVVGYAISAPINLAIMAHDALDHHARTPAPNKQSKAPEIPQPKDEELLRGHRFCYYVRSTVRVRLDRLALPNTSTSEQVTSTAKIESILSNPPETPAAAQ
jgi:hypothetical protein